MSYKIGDKFKNRNGVIGVIENIRGVARLVIRKNGRPVQSINLKDIDLINFEKVEDDRA